MSSWAWAGSRLPQCQVDGWRRPQLQRAIGLLRRTKALNCDLGGQPVILSVQPGPWHVACRWAIWRSRGVIVPLFTKTPRNMVEHVARVTGAKIVVADHQGIRVEDSVDLLIDSTTEPPDYDKDDEDVTVDGSATAQLLFTSGTTGLPKAVDVTHDNIKAQIGSLLSAWDITSNDHILHCLPLHHIHGIVNAMECILWAGGRVSFAEFKADAVWRAFCDRNLGVNVFMAVPTMYAKLIDAFDKMDETKQAQCREACQRFRVMISGSAALPDTVLERWRSITGHTLLERYGMTETGMVLSNPLHGQRLAGFVGKPLPSVEVCIKPDKASRQLDKNAVQCGELLVRGPTVCKQYFGNGDATAEAFDSDGWFRTGDIASVNSEEDYRIVGRASMDILKTAGYKVSALEVERELRVHPEITDCAVVGLPNTTYGDVIAAAVVTSLPVDIVRQWIASRLPPYKLPRRIRILEELPRNPMGKVDKVLIQQLLS